MNRINENKMALSRLDTYLIQDATMEFQKAVKGVRHEANLKDVLETARGKVKQNLMQKITGYDKEKIGAILHSLTVELEKVSKDYLVERDNRRKESEILLEKLKDFLCTTFVTSANDYLGQVPPPNLESLTLFLQSEKTNAIQNFLNCWKSEDVELREKYKLNLEEKLDLASKDAKLKHVEILNERKQLMDDENQQFAKMKQVIQQKSELLQSFIAHLKLDLIPNNLLLEKIEELKRYTEDQENFNNRDYRKVHKELLKKLAVARNGLFLLEKEMPPREAVAWVEDVNRHVLNSFAFVLRSSDDPHDIEINPAELAEGSGLNGHVTDSNEAAIDLSGINAIGPITRGRKRRDQEKVVASSSERPRRELATTSATEAKRIDLKKESVDQEDSVIVLDPCDSCKDSMVRVGYYETELELAQMEIQRLNEHLNSIGIGTEAVLTETAPMSKSTPSSGIKKPHYSNEDEYKILDFALNKYGLPGTEEKQKETFFEGLELQMKGGVLRGNSGLWQHFQRLVKGIANEGPTFLNKYRDRLQNAGKWKDWERRVVELALKAKPSPRSTPSSGVRNRTRRGATFTDSARRILF